MFVFWRFKREKKIERKNKKSEEKNIKFFSCFVHGKIVAKKIKLFVIPTILLSLDLKNEMVSNGKVIIPHLLDI